MFETNQDPNTEMTKVLEDLVGEGKKFKTVEDLARGKIEADNYIQELEAKAAKNTFAEELLKKLEEKGQTDDPLQTQSSPGESTPENTTLDAAAVADLVSKTITEREQTATVESNLTTVNQKLTELYGTESEAKVREKATQMGMSYDRLREIAGESPTAFFNLMGEAPKVDGETVHTSDTNTLSFNSETKRNKAYYDKIRKEDRDKFYSKEVQEQRFKDAQQPGFYD